MSSDSGIVKQLRRVIEENEQIIRTLRAEVDRLRYLLGLHSLKSPGAKMPEIHSPPPAAEIRPRLD